MSPKFYRRVRLITLLALLFASAGFFWIHKRAEAGHLASPGILPLLGFTNTAGQSFAIIQIDYPFLFKLSRSLRLGLVSSGTQVNLQVNSGTNWSTLPSTPRLLNQGNNGLRFAVPLEPSDLPMRIEVINDSSTRFSWLGHSQKIYLTREFSFSTNAVQ